MKRLIGLTMGLSLCMAHNLAAQDLPAKKPVAPMVDLGTMVKLEASMFPMGKPFQNPGPYGDPWFIDQTPEHTVDLSPFYMDKTEVTVGEFARFLNYAGGQAHYHKNQPIQEQDGTYQPDPGTSFEPIRQVTWRAAYYYCR